MVLDIIAKEYRAIHCLVLEKSTDKRCIVTANFAPAQNHEKHAFWNYLKSLNDILAFSWCILGDFNEMLHSSEKIGCTSLCASKLQRLDDFLSLCKGHDANVQGWIFHLEKFLPR